MTAEHTLGCPFCGLNQVLPRPTRGEELTCAQCHSPLARNKPNSLARTLAFSLSALLLYIPANILPIMTFEYYGASEPTTVWSGVVALAKSGMWLVAGIVFMASIVVPLVKLAALFFLTLSVRTGRGGRWRTQLYRAIKIAGPWAMLDVFLLAVLVAAVKLGQLATVTPGPAALPFTLVVVFTILATDSFDPALLWRHEPATASQH
jgi:paraquat-inducible protein A